MVRVGRKAGSELEEVQPPPMSGTRYLRNTGRRQRTLTWL
jgi:hypothetical protein